MSHDLPELRERLDAILQLPNPDTADEDLVGFYVAVRRLLGHPPLDWTAPGMGEVLVELGDLIAAARIEETAYRVPPAAAPTARRATFGHAYLVDEAGDGSGYRRRRQDIDGLSP